MDEATEERIKGECVEILRKVGCSEEVIRHCIAVAELALEIARLRNSKRRRRSRSSGGGECEAEEGGKERGDEEVDEELVFRGALLHDIGRSRTHGIKHAYVGAEIARSLGLDERIVRIIERHIGAGIPAEEAKNFGLPAKDFIPETIEEKIVACADNLIAHDRRMSIEEALEEFKERLGANHPAVERAKKLYEEVFALNKEKKGGKKE
ncbi:MAG: HDIG domain-containing protein [Candidatus Methanospirare jalkutatii]|nr:HDIG domain-containing protein [Candidatus Methanospirare jalkutatii]